MVGEAHVLEFGLHLTDKTDIEIKETNRAHAFWACGGSGNNGDPR